MTVGQSTRGGGGMARRRRPCALRVAMAVEGDSFFVCREASCWRRPTFCRRGTHTGECKMHLQRGGLLETVLEHLQESLEKLLLKVCF
jgi:hypothetical protein